MNHRNPEIITLRCEIEESVGRKLKTPSDFDFLSGAIWERLHEYLSPTTIKRTWGYIGGAQSIRNSTLNILARFAGYREWEEFMVSLGERSDADSDFVLHNALDARKFAPGALVEVEWHPDRHCIFRHLGECRFEVAEARNSKLRPGDTFEAVYFIEGELLYLDNLVQGAKAPASYLCGNKRGLTRAKVV